MVSRAAHGLPALLLVAAAVALVVGCGVKLPEEDSPQAKLYRQRCSDPCHDVYRPGSLTPKMWEAMMDRMEIDIHQAGQPPISERERALLLEYLQRHAYR